MIARADIEHRPSRAAWSFPLLSAASEDFWKRLESVGLLNLGAPAVGLLVYQSVPYLHRIQSGVGGEIPATSYQRADSLLADFPGLAGAFPDEIRCYTARSVVRAVLTSAGVGVGAPLPTWPFTVRTLGGPVTRAAHPRIASLAGWDPAAGEYSDTSLTLPAWTGRQLVEAVAGAAGWTVAVEYGPFPSLDLTVRFYPARPEAPDPATLGALDGREAAGGVTRRGEPSPGEAFGVSLANTLAGPSPRMEAPTAVPFVGTGYLAAPPPPRATLALSAWAFDRKDGSGRAQAPEPRGEIVDVPFALPMIGPRRRTGTLDTFESTADGVAETHVYGLPVIEPGQTYLIATQTFQPPGGPSSPYALHARKIERTGELALETWAGAMYGMRSAEAGGREIAAGDFYLSGLSPPLRTGQPAAGALWGGSAWTVRSADTVLVDGLGSLVLERPASGGPPVPDYGAHARLGTVGDVGLSYRRWAVRAGPAVGYTNALVAEWAPPPVESAGDLSHYEVRLQRAGSAAGDWLPTYATAHVWSGDHVEGGATYTVAVRPVDAGGHAAAEVSFTLTAEVA